MVTAAGAVVKRRRALYARVDGITAAAINSLDQVMDSLEPVHGADGFLRPSHPDAINGARRIVLATLRDKQAELAPLVAEEHALAHTLRRQVDAHLEAVGDLMHAFALATTSRGKWALRGRRLIAMARGWWRHGTAGLRADGGDRHALRVRTAAATRDVARLLRRTIGTQLKLLDEALDADRDFHDALMAPLEVALARASRDLAMRFDTVAGEPDHGGRIEALTVATTRQLKRVRETLQQVKQAAEQRLDSDPVLSALSSTADVVATLPAQVDTTVRAEVHRPVTWWVRSGIIAARREVRIPARHLLKRWIDRHRALELVALVERLGAARGAVVAGLTDIWNIVRYNLDGAVAEADDLDELVAANRNSAESEALDKSRDMALTGLARAVRRTRELVVAVHRVHLQIREATEHKLALTNDITDAAAAVGSLRGRVRYWASRARFGAGRGRVGIGAGVGHLFRGAYRIAGNTGETLAKSRESLKKKLGLEVDAGTDAALRTHNLLAEHLMQRPDLPPVYRRLFKLSPLELDEFLIGRDAAMVAIEHATARWRDGDFASVLVHGHPGSGRRSLLNIAVDRVASGERVVHCVLDDRVTDERAFLRRMAVALELTPVPTDFEELLARILAGERLVLRLEGAHHLFLRSIGGFDAIERLLLLISRTNRHLLWLVAMENHSVELLQRLFRFHDGFTHIAPCGALSAEELRAAITVRHRLSGFKLRYEPPEALTPELNRALRRVRGDHDATQETLAAHFFGVLTRRADGRPYAGIVHWLRSLARAEDQHTLVVRVPEPLQVPALKQLPHNQRFALAALLQHGGLNVMELEIVLDVELSKLRLILQHFHDKRIVVAHSRACGEEDARRYVINPLLTTQVVDSLRKHNIVYWESP